MVRHRFIHYNCTQKGIGKYSSKSLLHILHPPSIDDAFSPPIVLGFHPSSKPNTIVGPFWFLFWFCCCSAFCAWHLMLFYDYCFWIYETQFQLQQQQVCFNVVLGFVVADVAVAVYWCFCNYYLTATHTENSINYKTTTAQSSII